jgi:hypothetical protein
VKLTKEENILVGLVYRSPNSSAENSKTVDDDSDTRNELKCNLDDVERDKGDVITELNGIQCYYTNADCLMNKRREVEVIIEMYKPKIIGIVESWCNSSILDSEVSFEGFNLFRKDKIGSNGVGGGALLYIHKSLEAAQYYDLDEIKMETSIWCEVKLTKEENILVGLVYRSPNSSAENNEALRNQLLRIETTRHDNNLLIFGDFNF